MVSRGTNPTSTIVARRKAKQSLSDASKISQCTVRYNEFGLTIPELKLFGGTLDCNLPPQKAFSIDSHHCILPSGANK